MTNHRPSPRPSPGPPCPKPKAEHGASRPPVTPIATCGPAPAIYRLAPLWHDAFAAIWRRLQAGHSLRIDAPPPAVPNNRPLLVFENHPQSPPLCLAVHVVATQADSFRVVAGPLALSWRLAAVHMLHGLSQEKPTPPTAPALHCDQWVSDGVLRLRPDLPGPVTDWSSHPELTAILCRLRAEFAPLHDLIATGDARPSLITSFLRRLAKAGLLVPAPAPFCADGDPFEFLGLHWSAHDPLVRRRYRQLSRQLEHDDRADTAGGDQGLLREQLESAFGRLHHPAGRRAVRHQRLSPPAHSEAGDYFYECLRHARREQRLDDAIDLCRRILELDPSDGHARGILHRLLARAQTRRPAGRRAN